MGGGTTAAEVIVVHARKVIVDERVGVHDLDRASKREGVFDFASAGLGGGKGEDGAEAFSAGKNGVAHALMNRFGALGDTGEEFVERVVDEDLLALEVIFEIGHGLDPNRNCELGNRLLRRSGMALVCI